MTFADVLAGWLPRQRWYAGNQGPIHELEITSDVTLLEGDPGLRHLVVAAAQGDTVTRYQVLAGVRSAPPASLSHAIIGPTGQNHASGQEMTAYDALHDPELAAVLLSSIADQRSTGPLRFVRERGALIEDWPDSRVLTTEQSNTSVVFGEAAILKMLRRPFPGQNPDLEVASALWRLGSSRVAAPLGWVEGVKDGERYLLGVLSRYLPHSIDGWSLAVTGLHELYNGDPEEECGYGSYSLAAQAVRAGHSAPGRLARGWVSEQAADPHFTGEAYLLGRATAEMHADLAAAFGTGPMPPEALTELADRMTRSLERARDEVPELRTHAAKLRASYADIAQITGPVPIQRVHGDYHLGQVLRTQQGWVALDFEGEPAVPLAQRRARYPALKDVAGMLRSFDYAARHQLLGHPDEEKLQPVAETWVERCQAAFCAGYAHAGGMDPLANAALLRALMLEKAVYEVVYEARHRPAWMSIPLGSIAAA